MIEEHSLYHGPWIANGQISFRRRFLVGPWRMMVRETRRVFRPIVMGHCPANWDMESRWRWATPAEDREVARSA